jgi:hypothetical protein
MDDGKNQKPEKQSFSGFLCFIHRKSNIKPQPSALARWLSDSPSMQLHLRVCPSDQLGL